MNWSCIEVESKYGSLLWIREDGLARIMGDTYNSSLVYQTRKTIDSEWSEIQKTDDLEKAKAACGEINA